jgi:hypothetical protein
LDGQPAGHADLYQVGQNPFEPDHSTQLRHLLGIFTAHVENEEWRVDADGVSEPASVFEDTNAQIDHDSDEAENMRFDVFYHMYLDWGRSEEAAIVNTYYFPRWWWRDLYDTALYYTESG